MISLYDQVPSIYTSASRDFQYLSWLFNIVLNSVKHNIDDIYNLPNVTGDAKLTELLAMTLGFKIKRNYDQKQLSSLVAVLHSALRYKGTEKAILMAADALVKAMGSQGDADVQIKGAEVQVTLPKDLIDITLFLDILDYILPAGMTCRVIRKSQNKKAINDIQVKYSDDFKRVITDDLTWADRKEADQRASDGTDVYTNRSEGLSGLYNIQDSTLNTANILDTGVLNAGLLDNTVIPVLKDSRAVKVETYVDLYTKEEDDSIKPWCDDNGIPLKAKKGVMQEL